jgi:hypothetical protein
MKTIITIIGTGAIVGVLAVVLVQLGNPANMGFCSACFERDIAGAMGLHQGWAMSWFRPEIMGIVIGAFLAALIFREFRPQGGSAPMARFILAFFTMVGAMCFLGCPLRMMLRLAGGDMNAVVAFFGFIAGIWGGVLLLKAGFNFGRTQSERSASGLILPLAMLGLLACAFIFPLFKEGAGKFLGNTGHIGTGNTPSMTEIAGVFVSLGAGLLIGFLGQRSRLCFAGGIRDIIIMRNFHLFYGIVAVFALTLAGNLVLGKFQLGFENQPIAHTNHVWNFLGMALVGLASVLLDGCPFRQLVLAGGGNTDSGVTILGMLTGAAVVHNFGLMAAKTTYGQGAVVVGIIVVVLISWFHREK